MEVAATRSKTCPGFSIGTPKQKSRVLCDAVLSDAKIGPRWEVIFGSKQGKHGYCTVLRANITFLKQTLTSDRRGSCFIAPICRGCNYHENPDRMQGSGSQIKHHTVVVDIGMTEEMRNAARRIAVEERTCERCDEDISDHPDSHTVCLRCYRNRRGCERCGEDISDRPHNYTRCYTCFRGWNEDCRKRKSPCKESPNPARRARVRRCDCCREDISNRPPSHTLCYCCYSCLF